MNTLSRLATAAALSLILQQGHAQQNRADDKAEAGAGNWYHIHLAVFGHRSESAEYEEVWRNKLQLKYPNHLVRLKTRERYLADLCGLNPAAQPAGDSAAGGNRLLDILERVDSGEGYRPEDIQKVQTAFSAGTLDSACKEVRPDLFPPDKNEIANTNAAAVVASAESLLSEEGNRKKTRQPTADLRSYVLDKQISDEEFAGLVKKLSGAYRYRLLFSGSWPQALQSRKQAAALLIEGGDAVGQHHELEGYIRIGLERYLHIDTDLWLSTFSTQRRTANAYDHQSAGNDYSAARQTPTNTNTYSANAAPQRLSEFPALPIPFPVNDPQARRSDAADRAMDASDSYSSESDRSAGFRPSSNLDLLSAEDSGYFVDRTVVMRQNRRMRSGEVHYLDHPMFGVLIKITPIAAPANADKPSNAVSQR